MYDHVPCVHMVCTKHTLLLKFRLLLPKRLKIHTHSSSFATKLSTPKRRFDGGFSAKKKNKYKILKRYKSIWIASMHAGRQLDRHGSFNSREKDAQTKQGYPNSLLFFAHSFVLLFLFFNLEKTIREQNLSIRLALHNLTLPFTIDSDRATKKKIARKQKRAAVLKHIAAPLNAIRDTK